MLKSIVYQARAVEKLVDVTKKLLDNEGETSTVIFKAPTGSGKTVMTANFIDRLIEEFEGDLCFLWISIGKGELHKQSKYKLEKIFGGYPKVSLLEDEFFGYRKEIKPREIVVISWESINNRDRVTGNWTNIAMRDGEKINFRSVLSNTKGKMKIITIFDESHIGTTTERAEEIKNEIQADIIIEMSATPKLNITAEDISDGKAGFVSVKIQDVIKEQMIKKRLTINEGFQGEGVESIDTAIMDAVYEKREELRKLLVQEGSKVNPLVIIQLPNAEEGEVKKKVVMDYLSEKDITTDNGRLAVWLSNGSDKSNKVNLEKITDNTSDVDFLIFKQAIDTGWDCPRACILLKFREISSETFGRQTLGRILRMPEQKHYVDDRLNKAYLYTDIEDEIVNIIDDDFDFPDENIDSIKLLRIQGYRNIQLKSFVKYEKRSPIYESEIKKLLNVNFVERYGLIEKEYEGNVEKLKSLNFNFKVDSLIQVIVNSVIDSEDLLSNKNEFKTTSHQDVVIDDGRVEVIFRRLLRSKSSQLGNDGEAFFQLLKSSLYNIFIDYIDNDKDNECFIVNIQRLVILNYVDFFNKTITDAVLSYKEKFKDSLSDITIEERVFEVPVAMNINKQLHEEVISDKYVYDKCYLQLNRSKPERCFEVFIKDNIDKVNWWFKNGDNGSQFMGIDYIYDGIKRTFYPDYIIHFANGKIGIFEVKDRNDMEGKTYTKAKAERLQQYIKSENERNKNLVGGIVSNFALSSDENLVMKINRKEAFTINNLDDWEELCF